MGTGMISNQMSMSDLHPCKSGVTLSHSYLWAVLVSYRPAVLHLCWQQHAGQQGADIPSQQSGLVKLAGAKLHIVAQPAFAWSQAQANKPSQIASRPELAQEEPAQMSLLCAACSELA